MQWLSGALRRSARIPLQAAVIVVATAICLEGTIELVLRHPQAVPSLFRPANRVSHLKNYYLEWDRSVVQLRHDCAIYDDRLSYRLRPGVCTVRNRESTVDYVVNRAGLRDSDDKLLAPAVIAIGDSHAMGWGVSGDETVAARLGSFTGRRVLNAAISSYDTGRELELLRELIRPETQYVMIAYCDNDYYDNWTFIGTGVLPHLDRAAYEKLVAEHERSVGYYPFKHLLHLSRSVWDSTFRRSPSPRFLQRPGFTAMSFVAILDRYRELLRGRHLIVFEVNGFNNNSPAFAASLRAAAAQSDLLSELSSMDVIDTSRLLTDDDYFLIDDHIRPSGHEKVARAVADAMQGETPWRVHRAADIVKPSGIAEGNVDTIDRKGGLTIAYGWAARRDSGEPPATVALLRDGVRIAAAEPVFVRTDVTTPAGKRPTGASGFALAVSSDRLAMAKSLQFVGIWPDGAVAPIANSHELRDN